MSTMRKLEKYVLLCSSLCQLPIFGKKCLITEVLLDLFLNYRICTLNETKVGCKIFYDLYTFWHKINIFMKVKFYGHFLGSNFKAIFLVLGNYHLSCKGFLKNYIF